MKMYIVWSNEIDQIESIVQGILDDPDNYFGFKEDGAYVTACELNDEYLDDERCNLNINVGTEIVVIGNLDLWDGKRMGYKLLDSENISDCFSGTCGDYVAWFVDDRGDLNCRDCHHDGTNLYLYRAWKPGVSETQKENFLTKVRRGQATRADITRYTRKIGTYVADVYGWKVRR